MPRRTHVVPETRGAIGAADGVSFLKPRFDSKFLEDGRTFFVSELCLVVDTWWSQHSIPYFTMLWGLD